MQFSEVVFLLYIPAVVYLFQSVDRVRATAIALLAAELFLPERVEFDPPLLPPFNKHSISTLVVFLTLLGTKKQKVVVKEGVLVPMMIAIALIASLGTYLTNRDTLVLSPMMVNYGLGARDFISQFSHSLLFYILPFWIGKNVFKTREDVTQFMKILAGFGIGYALLMLVEIRMSPQINVWVYGFHQHSWAQAVRSGGFRPIVFMAHGLATTLFCVTCLLALVTLGGAKEKVFSTSPYYFAIFLFGVLALSNSLGAFIYAVTIAPLLWMARPRLLAFVASTMALFVLLIPALRSMELLPLDDVIRFLGGIDQERAASLKFRFDMEEVLVRKAVTRYLFGFGGFGRSRIFDENGEDVVVADSAWIIMFGRGGIFAFMTCFLLLLLPIWVSRVHIKSLPDKAERTLLSGLVMLLATNTFDLLINGLFSYIPLLIAGVVYGYCETLSTIRSTGYSVPLRTPP